MGGIKPHRKGIQITFYWNSERYRPTLRIEPTASNLKYANRLKGEIEKSIALGTYTLERYATDFPTSKLAQSAPKPAKKKTFRDMAILWQKSVSHLSHGTLVKYNQALNFWLEYLGDTPIDDIQFSTIAALANSQSWNAKNRNNMLIPLRSVLELAFLDGIININPASRIKNGKVQKEPPDPLTLEEIDLVLDHMRKYDEQIYNYFEFAFFTGMRPSELISLRWGDVDFRGSTARVERARTFGVEHAPKTYETRDVELNKRAVAAITRQKKHTFLKDGYVFENPVTSLPYTEDRPLRRAYWNPTIKSLGLRERTCYQTRHTYATLNLMAGANPMWVSKQMGHANMQMLLTVYAKWINGADRSKECAKLDGLFSSVATRMPPEVQNAC